MVTMSASRAMDFNRTYEFGYAFNRGCFHFDSAHEIDAKGLLLGHEVPHEPVLFRRQSGQRTCDVMGTTYAALSLVSKPLIDVLVRRRFTGWSTFPVRLLDGHEQEIEGYVGLSVTGRAGPIDRKRARIELDPPLVPKGRPTYIEVGMYFDPDTWDGSDFFVPDGTTAVCVVSGVKEALEESAFTNVALTPLAYYQMNRYSEPPPGREVISRE